MDMVNPLAAFREGYDTTQGLFDAQTRRRAGNALAMGDYRQGANALLGGGMLGEGTDLLNYDQRNRQAQAEAMRAQEQAAKAAQAESLKTMLGGGQSLLQVQGATPEETAAMRRQVYQAQVRPLLQQQGVPDELLTQFDQSTFSDQDLQPFVTTLGGELEKPEWQAIKREDGSVILYDTNDPDTRRTLLEPDPFYAREREARIASLTAQEEQRRAAAARARRPPAARGGRSPGIAPAPVDYGSDPSGPRW